ncbi:MAG: THUMP domain-containing protein, partial [Candidatus Micrarchaeota archaeon]|nr:THUMP domain-containing protein [Candidatus Micrarchaeota archaeon]
MKLCPTCGQRFERKFEIGDCGICNDKMEKTKKIIESSDFRTEVKNARKFSITSSIGKKTMVNEERFFDFSNGESIKNQLNRMFYSKIREKTGMKYDTENPDVVFSINLETLDVSNKPASLFFFGRYKKLEKEIAQKRWIYEKFPSVEVIIGEKAVPFFEAVDYTMHASGREDIDVTNIAGRPFVMEIKEAKERKIDLKELEKEVNKD